MERTGITPPTTYVDNIGGPADEASGLRYLLICASRIGGLINLGTEDTTQLIGMKWIEGNNDIRLIPRFGITRWITNRREALQHRGHRTEIVVTDSRLVQAAARTLACSLSKNTTRTYDNEFTLFLRFCERQWVSPVLDGRNKREDEETLISFIHYEFDYHGNKYATLKGKLYSIRSHLMAEGFPDPLLNKPTLDQHMRGIKAMRGATEAKEPLPAASFRAILANSEGHSLTIRAAAIASVIAFYALLRVGERLLSETSITSKITVFGGKM